MRNVLVMIAALLVAACVEPEASTSEAGQATPTTSTDARDLTSTPDANATIAVPEVQVATDADVPTRAETARVFVNTTAPTSVTVRLNGSEIFNGEVEQGRIIEAPLAFGKNAIQVVVVAPGLEKEFALDVVRLAQSSLTVDYGIFHPSSQGMPKEETHELWFDVDSRPSAAAYTEQGQAHIDAFTGHDQLVLFEAATGKKVEFEYFPSFQGFGVNKIDGAGSPIDSDAPPWWCYTINGNAADGISIQPIAPGDVVVWTLGSCAG